MHARQISPGFPVQRNRVVSGAGDEEAFETKASPPAVAGPLVSVRPQAPSPGAGDATGNNRGQSLVLDLLTGAESLGESLERLVAAAAQSLEQAGPRVECAVVLHQAKRSPLVTGTSRGVVALMEWEQKAAEGPTAEVLAGGHPVAVLQRNGDFRWPQYCNELQRAGFGSALGVRLRLPAPGGEPKPSENPAALAFFAQDAKAFPLQVIAEVRAFAGMAARSLQMALDFHSARSTASNLQSALESRTSINIACGVIMAQNRCSYHEAFDILAKASSHRNVKVRLIAEDILARLPEGAPRPHFVR